MVVLTNLIYQFTLKEYMAVGIIQRMYSAKNVFLKGRTFLTSVRMYRDSEQWIAGMKGVKMIKDDIGDWVDKDRDSWVETQRKKIVGSLADRFKTKWSTPCIVGPDRTVVWNAAQCGWTETHMARFEAMRFEMTGQVFENGGGI